MDSIVDPKQASPPGGSHLPPVQAVRVSFFPMVYLTK